MLTKALCVKDKIKTNTHARACVQNKSAQQNSILNVSPSRFPSNYLISRHQYSTALSYFLIVQQLSSTSKVSYPIFPSNILDLNFEIWTGMQGTTCTPRYPTSVRNCFKF